MSPASARADYGVVVDAAAWTVDAAASERLRVELRAARGAAPTEARLQRDEAPPG
ncbi:MAG: hypothetical protein HY359_09710 [Candidatus Rokubacteria bacterium]|nr:hypothetical protein [Candidatus Rokubacteria bacterium]